MSQVRDNIIGEFEKMEIPWMGDRGGIDHKMMG